MFNAFLKIAQFWANLKWRIYERRSLLNGRVLFGVLHSSIHMIIIKIYIIWIPKRYQIWTPFSTSYVGAVEVHTTTGNSIKFYTFSYIHLLGKEKSSDFRFRRPLIKFATWMDLIPLTCWKIGDAERWCGVLLGICIIHDIFNLSIVKLCYNSVYNYVLLEGEELNNKFESMHDLVVSSIYSYHF